MKRLFLMLFLQMVLLSCIAQTPVKSCIYIGDKDKHVLSERIKTETGEIITYNSLFIWQKERVIRIIFLHDRKIPAVNSGTLQKLTSLNAFLPSYEKYEIRPLAIHSIYVDPIYEGRIIDRPKKKYADYDYSVKLKTAINNRNRVYNPLADRFGSHWVSDGNPEFLYYNEKRKEAEVNNLPLIFNTAKGDSTYIVSPIVINIYRIDTGRNTANLPRKAITRYKLYSTVSFLEQGMTFPDNQYYGEPYKGELENDIATLPYLYKMSFPQNEGDLVNYMAKFNQADLKKYNVYPDDAVIVDEGKLLVSGTPAQQEAILKKHKRYKDSVKARQDSVQAAFERDCFGHYEYCKECYNPILSKTERIKMHCPLKIASYGVYSDYAENWSYAFFKNRPYFEVETGRMPYNGPPGPASPETDVSDYNYPINWVLMSPGVGYWMRNVAGNSRKYQNNFGGFILDGSAVGY